MELLRGHLEVHQFRVRESEEFSNVRAHFHVSVSAAAEDDASRDEGHGGVDERPERGAMSERGDRPGHEAGGDDGLLGSGEPNASVGDAERAGEFLNVHAGLAVRDDHHERAVGGEDERLDDLGDVHAEGGRAGRDVGGVVALAAHELDVGAAGLDPSREVDGREHARGGDRGRAEGGRGRRRAFR